MLNDGTEAIIQSGEERTVEWNSKYVGLNLEYLGNVKSEASVQRWEGEDLSLWPSTIPSCECRTAIQPCAQY
jgi:hypothetical protein